MNTPEPVPEWAAELAAQAWCTPETSHLTMIPALAFAFARIIADHAPKETGATATAGKELIYCLDSSAEGMGSHINSKDSALAWFSAYLDNLNDGETDDITVKRRDMTQPEIDALPEQ